MEMLYYLQSKIIERLCSNLGIRSEMVDHTRSCMFSCAYLVLLYRSYCGFRSIHLESNHNHSFLISGPSERRTITLQGMVTLK